MHYLCSTWVHMTCDTDPVTRVPKRYSALVVCVRVHVRLSQSVLFIMNFVELPSCNCSSLVPLFGILMCACACVPAWVLSSRTSSRAWSQASYSIQQLWCKTLIWKSKSGVYVRLNRHLRATLCSCGCMKQFGIWHFFRLQMEIILSVVCVPETPSMFTHHLSFWSWWWAMATLGKWIICVILNDALKIF